MICENCKTKFECRNYGFLNAGGRVVDICSTQCRATYRLAISRLADAVSNRAASKRANAAKPAFDNAGKGVKIQRQFSTAEIKKKMRPKEGDISKAIGQELDKRGAWNTRIQSGQIKTPGGGIVKLAKAGTPDRIAGAGLTIWIEVKRPGEVARPDQLATIAKLKAAGALAFVLDDPTDCDFIFKGLELYSAEVVAINCRAAKIQSWIDHAIASNRAAKKAK